MQDALKVAYFPYVGFTATQKTDQKTSNIVQVIEFAILTTMEVRLVRFSWNGNQFKNARSADLAYRKPRLHNWPWRPPPGNRTTSVRLFALFSWKKNRPGPPNYPWKTNGFKAQLLINQRHIPCNSFAAIPLLELNWTNGPIIRVRKKCPSMCVYLLPIDFSIISAL